MYGKFNVASNANLPGPIDQLWERFEAAGFQDQQLPDDEGWMPKAAFPNQVVGRIAIRDELAARVRKAIGRGPSYSRAQKCNLMREGRVLERCDWVVASIPAIVGQSLQAITEELVGSKRRREGWHVTDSASGSRATSTTISEGTDKVCFEGYKFETERKADKES